MFELNVLKNCLEKYCYWSGRVINVEKSGVFPSKGVSQQFLNQIKSCWGINKLPPNSKYLGVPLFFSASRSRDLNPIKEKLENKLSSWKSKNLSWQGRATPIKSVAQAIPAYSMTVIQFPRKLCKRLDAVVRRFWWNPKSNSGSFLTPIAWSSLFWPLKEGGFGFRKFWDFNQALLSKLAWWILSEKDFLCVKVLKAKYKVRGNWLNYKTMGSPSKIWRGLEGMKSLLARSACMLIGNRNTIRIWEDPWIPNLPNFIPSPRERTSPEMALIVSQLVNQEGWDLTKIRNTFDETIS